MKLHTDPRSLNTTKVLWLLHHHEIPFELVTIDLTRQENRSEHFTTLNPNRRVPVLEDGDLILWESNAILQYLAEKHQSDLLPQDLRGRAELQRWLSWQLAHWGPALGTLTFQRIAPHLFPGFQVDHKAVEEAQSQLDQLAPVLDGHLRGRQAVLGQFGLADIALASFASERAQAGIDLSGYRHISNWLERLEAQPAFQAATRSRAHA